MRIFGFEIRRVKKAAPSLSGVDDRGWRILESFAGAWQADVSVSHDQVMAFHAVYSCITLIANDIGKLRAKLVEKQDGIWTETESPSFSPVLRKPNRYQNAIQFRESWVSSKLSRGNTYALKERDSRGIVVALYILDPSRVTPLVTPQGDVYYRLQSDNMSGLESEITVPASEIIHDRMNCLFHPLVGLSPIYACGLAATQGLAMQANSAKLFQNMSRPSGIITAPGRISQESATTLKEQWESNYSGANFGKIAVLGDNLKFEKISMTSEEAQLIDQLKWTSEVVCSTFHVPAFKIGLGAMPTYQNAEVLNQIYYSDCLQSLIEQYEACMDEGLGLGRINGRDIGVELDLDGLLRMDTQTQIKTLTEAVKGSILTIDEARAKMDRKKVPGGSSIWMQQQNYSLEALAERDANSPFAAPAQTQSPAADSNPDDLPEDPEDDSQGMDETDDALARLWQRQPEGLAHA